MYIEKEKEYMDDETTKGSEEGGGVKAERGWEKVEDLPCTENGQPAGKTRRDGWEGPAIGSRVGVRGEKWQKGVEGG